ENLAFLGGPDAVQIAPVYDPAPMRAWPRHNLRSAIPIAFDGALSVRGNLLELGTVFGLRRAEVESLFEECLQGTRSYVDRVLALETVPEARRRQLADIVGREQRMLQTA
ncbi:MAG: hypothetical protein WCY26_11740, partial [Thiohalobacteraceae bacterium]